MSTEPVMLRARSSAKVNLSLDIVGRRADGYHDLASVVHTVGLWDEIGMKVEPGWETEVRLSSNVPAMCEGDNLCARAARWFSARHGVRFGAEIYLKKNIPAGAGLGGGSGNAAAVLMMLQEAFSGLEPIGPLDYPAIATALGADVPLFLEGGCVLMEGIGERISALAPLEGWLLVVQYPGTALSTPAVYRAFDEGEHRSAHGTPRLLAALRFGQPWMPLLSNDFEWAVQSLGFPAHVVVEQLLEAGAGAARMTGSGSAVFGVFESWAAASYGAQQFTEMAKNVRNSPGLSLDPWFQVVPLCAEGVSGVGSSR